MEEQTDKKDGKLLVRCINQFCRPRVGTAPRNIFYGEATLDGNESFFVFTIPYNESYKKFVVKKNNFVKNSRNISLNVPNIILTSTIANRTYTNEIINVNWSASDLDSDNLSYAILLSHNIGSNWNTLDFDFNQTNYSINMLDLQDGKDYLIKVMATDGVNTNFTITNKTFEIDNDLQIKDFSIVYQIIQRELRYYKKMKTFINLRIVRNL